MPPSPDPPPAFPPPTLDDLVEARRWLDSLPATHPLQRHRPAVIDLTLTGRAWADLRAGMRAAMERN